MTTAAEWLVAAASLTVQDKTDIADAILAAAQVTPIHADTHKMNGFAVVGTGQAGDDWRAEGVPPNVV